MTEKHVNNMTDELTPIQATSESASAELAQAKAVAIEAQDRAQRALIAEAVEAGMQAGVEINLPRIIALENWKTAHDEIVGALATKKDLEGLATQSDIKEIVNVFGNIKIAANVFAVGGRFGYKTLLITAGAIGALAVIIAFVKAGLAGLIAWAIVQK